MAARASLRIGLTGGIGSGKSTVAAGFTALGGALIDTDAISRSLTLPGGAAMPAIVEQFGSPLQAADGALDRARMRDLVFADPSARQRLEAILHPLIRAEALRQESAAQGSAVVFDVPLLMESGRWRERLDRVLVVDCQESTQVERVMARSGWTREAVQSVIAQQAGRRVRRAGADAVIYNDGISREELLAQVRALWKGWSARV